MRDGREPAAFVRFETDVGGPCRGNSRPLSTHFCAWSAEAARPAAEGATISGGQVVVAQPSPSVSASILTSDAGMPRVFPREARAERRRGTLSPASMPLVASAQAGGSVMP